MTINLPFRTYPSGTYCGKCGRQNITHVVETGRFLFSTGNMTYYHYHSCPEYKEKKFIFHWGNGHDARWDCWTYNGCEGINVFDAHGNKIGNIGSKRI